MKKSILRTLCVAAIICAVAGTVCSAHVDPNSPTFTFFAWRSIGYLSNDMPNVKARCFLGSDGTVGVGETGMAEQGWHELHPLPGPQTATIEDFGEIYPTIAGPVMVGTDSKDWAVFDLSLYWPYESDVLGYSQSHTKMGQTFVASGRELDKISMHLNGEPDDLYAVVREGGPDGKQVGSMIKADTGVPGDGIRAGWMVARWAPGDAPLTAGKTYYIELERKSGKPFAMRMHSTGNIYDKGCAYFDGVAEEMSDLGILIAEERDDMIRSKILYTQGEGWVRKAKGVYFKARSANIRAIYSRIEFPNTPFHLSVIYRVYEIGKDGQLIRIGQEKHGYNYSSEGTAHYVTAIYGADEMPLEVGKTYFVEIVPQSDKLPKDESKLPKMDLQVRVYGEKIAGMTPVIYNQHITETTSSAIKLAWRGSTNVGTKIYYGLDPKKLDRVMNFDRGVEKATISGIAPGTAVSFRMVKTTPEGGKFETPVYQARTLDVSGNVVKDPPLRATPHHTFLTQCIGFLNLAHVDMYTQPKLPEAKAVREIALANADFEDGLKNWQVNVVSDRQEDDARVMLCKNAASGSSSAGWNIDITEDKCKDVNSSEVVYQKVKVTPGKTYMLTASLNTFQDGHGDNWYARFNWGDVKARLVVDPKGGTDFTGLNSSQWFRTEGKWLTFAKKMKAESDTMTIGVGFTAIRNWPKVTALADNIKLVEVAE